MATIYVQGLQVNTVTRRKVIPSHVGVGRFYQECEQGDHGWAGVAGYIPRLPASVVPSPFAFSPVHVVRSWRGLPVILSEVSHRRYAVFQVFGPIWDNEDLDGPAISEGVL